MNRQLIQGRRPPIDTRKTTLLGIGSQIALTDEVKRKWRAFVENNHRELPVLAKIVVALHRLGMLPEFVNFYLQSRGNCKIKNSDEFSLQVSKFFI